MRKRTRKVCMGSIAIVLLVAMQPGIEAQALNGSILGNVTDTSEAAVADAAVSITKSDTKQARETTTSSVGSYSFSTVQPGVYVLRVTKPGFGTLVKSNIQVTADNVTRMDVALKVGTLTETVTVEAAAVAALQTDSGEVRHELATKDLNSLPVPVGRNYQSLLATVPGFTPPQNNHSVPTNPSRALTFNVNGGDLYQNNTKIDGATTSNLWLPDIVALVPTLESIETVNVATNSFEAETGSTGGAAISVQTKSGTNQVHGVGFEGYTGNALKARPFFLPSNQQKGKLVSNEFGGAVGGPIVKDKLFYFLSYEGSSDLENAQVLVTVPTAAIKSGDESGSTTPIFDPMTGTAKGANRTPFPGNILPPQRIDPIALKISNMLPLPNVPANPLTNNFNGTGNYAFYRHRADTKMNWNPTEKYSSSVRFSMLSYTSNDAAIFGPIGGINVNNQGGDPGTSWGSTYSLTDSHTYVLTPTLILDGYFAWEHDTTQTEPEGTGRNLGLELGIPGTNGPNRYQSGLPYFVVNNYAPFGTANTSGGGDPYYRNNSQFQEVANLNWTRGAHDLRFGMEIQQQYIDNLQPNGGGGQGTFTFAGGPTQTVGGPSANQYNTYANFLLGLVTTGAKSVVFDDNPPQEPINWHLYSFYARDRWTVSRKLTASYGVRWEYFGFPNARTRGIGVYDIAANNVKICGYGSVPAQCGISMPKKLFSPRLGLAYRVTDSFVIRAGYGMNQTPFSLGRSVLGNYPTTITSSYPSPSSYLWASTLEQGLPPITVPSLGNGIIAAPTKVNMSVLPQTFQWPYLQTWNLTLQKEFKSGFSAQAGYVANRFTHAMTTGGSFSTDLNAGQVPGLGREGQPFFAAQGRTSKVSLFTPRGTNRYDALQTNLSRRFAQGIQITANYTWSKAVAPFYLTDAINYQYLNVQAPQDFDRTHNLTISGTWELPFGKGKRWLANNAVAAAVFGGWTVNSLAAFYSGLPFNVTASANSLNMPGATQQANQIKAHVETLGGIGDAPFFDPLAFAAVRTPAFGNSGYNSMRGPGELNADLGLSRVFKVGERYTIQFRAEAFNITNTPHFANPNSNVSNLVLNSDGTVRNLGGFAQVQEVANTGRDGIDERQFRFMMKIRF